jgi:hypothetical protein
VPVGVAVGGTDAPGDGEGMALDTGDGLELAFGTVLWPPPPPPLHRAKATNPKKSNAMRRPLEKKGGRRPPVLIPRTYRRANE